MRSKFRSSIRTLIGAVALVAQLGWIGGASAQVPIGVSTQFDITGFLQAATLDSTCASDPHCGGTLQVNGHTVIVPKNTVVIFPANALTWQEVFAQAPAPYALTATGMAMADIPAPLTTYEVHVVGNRVANGTSDQYIAGLIDIAQQGLNSGAGFINFIDYTVGEMRVGGKIVLDAAGKALNVLDAANPGTRVRINDPVGRYGRINSPDKRFTVDADNPTITAGTGFPMCLPDSDPAGATPDVRCPQGNRPLDGAGNPVQTITMPDPASVGHPLALLPDPRIQVPMAVGDYISFSGTLVTDAPTPTTGPVPANGPAGEYVSAHTITNNVAVFTAPGTNPAYLKTDVTLLGTGGLTALGIGEAVVRTRFEGMSTDPSRGVHLYAIDVDPVTGATSDRDWGTIAVDPGPPTGAVKGRWRFRPPCAPFGTLPAKPDKECVMNAVGVFVPPPREMRAVIEGQQGQNPSLTTALTAANGLFYGQYHAPILTYIFPENVPGTPIVPNNFESIPFLACGGYISAGGTLAGPLSPWPGAVPPTCTSSLPVANAGPVQNVTGGAAVTLNGSATGATPMTFAWTQLSGPPVTLTGTNPATFTAPSSAAGATLIFQLTATNSAGSSIATVTINVAAASAPSVNPIAPVTVSSGVPVTLTASCPAASPCTSFLWTQTAGSPIVLVPNPKAGATIGFTVTLPVGSPATVFSFNVVGTNAAGVQSAPQSTSVTVKPAPDSVAIATTEYRIGKERLVITANSSVISPNVVLTLQPYVTNAGTVYNPDPAAGGVGNVFTSNGGGLYTLTLVGPQHPLCNAANGTFATPCSATPLVVKSSLGGVSPAAGLQKIRN